jgi:hypothetical protein
VAGGASGMLRASERAPGNSPWIAWIGKSVFDMYGLALTVLTATHRWMCGYVIPMSCAVLVMS